MRKMHVWIGSLEDWNLELSYGGDCFLAWEERDGSGSLLIFHVPSCGKSISV
jgi:hypothetical protein